jgi:nicotinamidase-related amidase
VFAFVLIDPVCAFTAETGSYALAKGTGETRAVREAVPRIAALVARLAPACPLAWVRSVYAPKQFAVDGPLAELCLAGTSDTQFDPLLAPPRAATVITKHEMDATSSPSFVAWLAEMEQRGTDELVLGGFLLTSCVRATALGTAQRQGSMRITVPLDLTADRRLTHLQQAEDRDRYLHRALRQLARAGVATPRRPDDWIRGIPPNG